MKKKVAFAMLDEIILRYLITQQSHSKFQEMMEIGCMLSAEQMALLVFQIQNQDQFQ
jgi:hypothetical protein